MNVIGGIFMVLMIMWVIAFFVSFFKPPKVVKFEGGAVINGTTFQKIDFNQIVLRKMVGLYNQNKERVLLHVFEIDKTQKGNVIGTLMGNKIINGRTERVTVEVYEDTNIIGMID